MLERIPLHPVDIGAVCHAHPASPLHALVTTTLSSTALKRKPKSPPTRAENREDAAANASWVALMFDM